MESRPCLIGGLVQTRAPANRIRFVMPLLEAPIELVFITTLHKWLLKRTDVAPSRPSLTCMLMSYSIAGHVARGYSIVGPHNMVWPRGRHTDIGVSA